MLRILLLAASFLSVVALNPNFLFGRPKEGFLKHGYIRATGQTYSTEQDDESYPYLIRKTIAQPVDPFNETGNAATYQQRYWYNPLYVNNTSAFSSNTSDIVFLMLQGESPAEDHWAAFPNLSYITWAREYGAHVFQLEHRCFGWSRPFPNMTTNNLKLCTSRHALADAARFIQLINTDNYLGLRNPRWVIFGGSYPGALTAWFREVYPDLSVGAVASSGIINLKLNFYEYAMVVQDAMTATDPNCAAAIQDAFARIIQLSISNEGRRQLNTYFNLTHPFQDDNATQQDIDNTLGTLYGTFQIVTQYTYDGRNDATMGGFDVRSLCNIMTDSSVPDTITRVMNVMKWQNGFYPGTLPIDTSYAASLPYLTDVTFDDVGRAASRGWMWLCCNELGFLQTTDQGRNIFGQSFPLNFYLTMCQDVFSDAYNNYDAVKVRDQNAKAQDYYGGVDYYTGTKVVLPNGAFDPWHAVGAGDSLYSQAAQRYPILTQGAAHCSDMYPPWPGEAAGIGATRQAIKGHIEEFIALKPSSSL